MRDGRDRHVIQRQLGRAIECFDRLAFGPRQNFRAVAGDDQPLRDTGSANRCDGVGDHWSSGQQPKGLPGYALAPAPRRYHCQQLVAEAAVDARVAHLTTYVGVLLNGSFWSVTGLSSKYASTALVSPGNTP